MHTEVHIRSSQSCLYASSTHRNIDEAQISFFKGKNIIKGSMKRKI